MEREGGDITAADMIPLLTEPSQIQNFYADSTIFVTGGTGFLGRLLIEKLLRSCMSIRKIYILLRPKEEMSCEQRYENYFEGPLYERLKREQPDSMQKLSFIEGDCELPNLGLKEEDAQIIIEEVNSIFHLATSTHSDQSLKVTAYVNVRCTRDLLKIARKIKNLTSILYMSTTSAHCPLKMIDEKFYQSPISADKLLSLVEALNDEKLKTISPIVIENWPNTFAFSKCIAENLIQKESCGLPIALIRPSMVVGTAKEPVAGWINKFYGITRLFTQVSLGVIRTLHCEETIKADFVPADYVVNCAIAASWDVAVTKKFHENSEVLTSNTESDVLIYNYVNGIQKSISWEEALNLEYHHIQNIPSSLEKWNYFFLPTQRQYVFLFFHYLFHIFPALIIDIFGFFINKKYCLIETYGEIKEFLDDFSYFTCRQWVFRNNKTQELWKKLNDEDKKIFEFNMAVLDWDLYFHTFARGSRVYLLEDPLETIPDGEKKRTKLKLMHHSLIAALSLFIFKLCYTNFYNYE